MLGDAMLIFWISFIMENLWVFFSPCPEPEGDAETKEHGSEHEPGRSGFSSDAPAGTAYAAAATAAFVSSLGGGWQPGRDAQRSNSHRCRRAGRGAAAARCKCCTTPGGPIGLSHRHHSPDQTPPPGRSLHGNKVGTIRVNEMLPARWL